MLKVGINGFGRIGRAAFKVVVEKFEDQVGIVAINDLTSPEVLAHLLQYDSAYGRWGKEVFINEQNLIVEGKKYPILSEKIPANLPWGKLGVEVVIESTGRFTDEEGMRQHLLAGAKKVVLTAPAHHTPEESPLGPPSGVIPTYIMGVNHDQYKGEQLINNTSCTTNCIAPVMAIIQEKFGILKAVMTTSHGVTAEQNLVDGPPPGGKATDLRRARAAYVNIIPTTTGAAVATTEAIPALKNLFDGRALRVPVIVGSIADITLVVGKKTSVEEVNQAIKIACLDARWRGIVAWSEESLVSTDIIGRSESAIVDLPLTQVIGEDLVKIFAWYDNEWGYSNRLVEMVINISKS